MYGRDTFKKSYCHIVGRSRVGNCRMSVSEYGTFQGLLAVSVAPGQGTIRRVIVSVGQGTI